eukprot:TRINITY_DN15819_c0_g1_i1.p2 TRINITY_DN15819_c0_g1~~TRINITY_DN15819_c0_g1_i1.p2  ORF type:complete len:121 (-),score=32.03 TRINITY_DN15819_c0_g1_i1:105-467(-)
MIRRPPRSTQSRSSAASDVYKRQMEFESFYSGTLLKIGIGEGESSLVDAVLAIIGPKGTDVSGIIENFKKQDASSNSETKTSEEKPLKEETSVKETKKACLLYTSPSPRDRTRSRMPSSA